jgi:hypothetical protein
MQKCEGAVLEMSAGWLGRGLIGRLRKGAPSGARQKELHLKAGMCHTVLWDVQYGKLRVKYDMAYYTNMPYDTSWLQTKFVHTLPLLFKSSRMDFKAAAYVWLSKM